MMNERNPITIDQALHGYSNGHRLIKSSTNLSSADDRLMLLISDMSGPSMVKGFETYVTGYPLSKKNAYVLAKTWYAPEMERPGCVWTHSLIIQAEELDFIDYIDPLFDLFECPSGSQDFSQYQEKIEIYPRKLLGSYYLSQDETNWFKKIVYSLYEFPDKQVFITSDETGSYDTIIKLIWTYQWENLKLEFSFCTGAIENRKLSDLIFDLQIIPKNYKDKLDIRDIDAMMIDTDEEFLYEYPLWVEYLANDISSPSSSKLKPQLITWGTDIKNGRKIYSALIEIHALINRSIYPSFSEIKEYVDRIALTFPKRSEAVVLKLSLFRSGSKTDQYAKFDSIDEYIFEALFSTEYVEAYDPILLNIEERARSIYLYNASLSKKLMHKIISGEPNIIAEAFIMGTASEMNGISAVEFSRGNEKLLLTILYSNPSLGGEKEIWESTNDLLLERFETIISSPNIIEQDVIDTIDCVIATEVNVLAKSLFSSYNEIAVERTIYWLNQNKKNLNQLFSDEWRTLLVRDETLLLTKLEEIESIQITTIAYIACLLDPNSKLILDSNLKFWISTLNEIGSLEYSTKVSYSSLLFIISLNTTESLGSELFAGTYLTVYNAAKNNDLRYKYWQSIERYLPGVHWSKRWDKCERLRRGILNQFINKNWDPACFIRATNQKDVFESILNYAKYNSEIREYLSVISKKTNELSNLQTTSLDDHNL